MLPASHYVRSGDGSAMKEYDYDAIIIGARCAGASTAMLLARMGHRVLVDRAHFPRDIAHGHLIHSDGPPRLSRWAC